MLSIKLISTPDEVLAYAERKRSTPTESHILSMCVPLPGFSVPLPSCKPRQSYPSRRRARTRAKLRNNPEELRPSIFRRITALSITPSPTCPPKRSMLSIAQFINQYGTHPARHQVKQVRRLKPRNRPRNHRPTRQPSISPSLDLQQSSSAPSPICSQTCKVIG